MINDEKYQNAIELAEKYKSTGEEVYILDAFNLMREYAEYENSLVIALKELLNFHF